jgi:hypothetical protein
MTGNKCEKIISFKYSYIYYNINKKIVWGLGLEQLPNQDTNHETYNSGSGYLPYS